MQWLSAGLAFLGYFGSLEVYFESGIVGVRASRVASLEVEPVMAPPLLLLAALCPALASAELKLGPGSVLIELAVGHCRVGRRL